MRSERLEAAMVYAFAVALGRRYGGRRRREILSQAAVWLWHRGHRHQAERLRLMLRGIRPAPAE